MLLIKHSAPTVNMGRANLKKLIHLLIYGKNLYQLQESRLCIEDKIASINQMDLIILFY
jgi:hypothetical protein